MRGLYAITQPEYQSVDELMQQVDQAITGGAAVIQYRDKSSSWSQREQVAIEIHALCRERGALMIINDDVQLAQMINADGVHLGRDDMLPADARRILGMGKLIGVSCYADMGRAQMAQQQGADYVAFGSFFPSTSKPEAIPAPIDVLVRAKAEIGLAIVAIGGITADNGRALIDAGADMLAVIHGVFGQQDIVQASRDIAALFY
ncbi:MAG: thiamine phosphate synthase [Gammaproteobacteria bacterium]|nr:MAG: thiamine phosphate synthase [Gammaproteobacteria bacterium]